MNRYHGINRPATIGGPSKASATTTCQKCLKKGHYSYECKANAQERPYVSRPSRTQQLSNPKLVPKLTSDVPQDLLKKKGIADEQLAKLEQERGRKRERQNEDMETGASKRRRSASSASVSTISTNMSRSPSPREARRAPNTYKSRRSHSPPQPAPSRYKRSTPSLSPSPSPPRQDVHNSRQKRRRDASSSVDSYSSRDEEDMRDSRERGNSRSTRKRFNDRSPEIRGRRTESRSPYRGRRNVSTDRRRFDEPRVNKGRRETFASSAAHAHPPRERSMSPFSKRLALTQAMNMDR
ncbi:uncharacterized protein EAE97_009266 [Botrytis byssoidea]|uniref:Zinc knuckle-domain-containing protein n=1 Tax=Botrytis byssoidea TaxID=139641 RepID=A0A9P5LMW0_9HELO|nr:uncharacterized protein EAE97_009266 [Botrytis byssoidea]KAF7931057.1 hypothetical protein EAE97_009266 [Botrytis byssoidea]